MFTIELLLLDRLIAGATLSLRSPHITDSFCTAACKIYAILND